VNPRSRGFIFCHHQVLLLPVLMNFFFLPLADLLHVLFNYHLFLLVIPHIVKLLLIIILLLLLVLNPSPPLSRTVTPHNQHFLLPGSPPPLPPRIQRPLVLSPHHTHTDPACYSPLPPRIQRPIVPSPYHTHTDPAHYSQPTHLPTGHPSSTHPHCHGHCHSTSSPTTSKTLPTVSHIPVLTSKSNFFAWDEGVTSLLHANGLLGHIMDPSEPIDLSQPDRMASPLPTLPPAPLREEIDVFNSWWDRDNVAQHILITHLGSIPRSLLPSPNVVTRTALSIYKMLSHYYGTCSFADCTELLSSLHTSSCTSGRVLEYVSKWRSSVSCLQSAKFIFNIKICISLFIRGLPLVPAFTTLRATLPERLDGIMEFDLGALITLTENVLELDTIFHSASQLQGPRPACPIVQGAAAPSPALPSSSTPSSGADPASRSAKPVLTWQLQVSWFALHWPYRSYVFSAGWRNGRTS
jgi:hypothetical protein